MSFTRLLAEPTEKEIQAGVKKILRDLGFWWVDNSQPRAAMVTPGLADLIVFGRGVLAFVEVKSATGKLTSAQRSFREHVVNNGGIYLVARSSADIVRWVESLPRKKGRA